MDFGGCFPLCFPLREFQHIFDEGVHPGCTGLLHLVGDVAVNIQGKGGSGVAKIALDCFDVVACSDGGNCEAVSLEPIRK